MDDDDPIVSDWDDEEATGQQLLEDPESQIESAAAFHCEEAPEGDWTSPLQPDDCSQRVSFEALPLSSVDPPPMWGTTGIPLWIDIERVHDEVYGSLFGYSDPWTMVGRVIETDGPSSDDQPSLQELSLSIEAEPSLPTTPSQSPAFPEVNERITPIETDSHLRLPQLEQVNGKYVGPSLFAVEVSDEE